VLRVSPWERLARITNHSRTPVEAAACEGLGVAPSGKAINVTGVSIMRIANGMLVEARQNWDMLGLMEQIQGSHKAATYVSAPAHISTINAV